MIIILCNPLLGYYPAGYSVRSMVSYLVRYMASYLVSYLVYYLVCHLSKSFQNI